MECVKYRRGLTGRIDELRLIVSELRSSLQVMSFSETWAHKDVADPELEIPGFKLFRPDRGIKGGGLAVYVTNDVKVMPRPDLEESTIDGLWVEVCLPKSRSFLVGTFYKPPACSNRAVKDFMPIFDNCLRRVMAMDKDLIITGDLNYNLLPKRTTESDCKQLKGLLRQENLTQLINQPTRITQYSKTLLDIIITNSPHNIRKSGVLSLSLSDHNMVFCIRKLNWMKAVPEAKHEILISKLVIWT